MDSVFPTVRIVPPPPVEEWTWKDCLGVSERYRKEPLDLALKQLFLMLTMDCARDDRLWHVNENIMHTLSIMDRFDPLGQDYISSNWPTKENSEPKEKDFTTDIFGEIREHILASVLAQKKPEETYTDLFEKRYFEPLRKHQENVQAWQARRTEVIWQRYFILAPFVRLIGWVARQCLGIATKEQVLAHSKDPHYNYNGSKEWPLSLHHRAYRHLERDLKSETDTSVHQTAAL